ncbi:hypothetical protein [Oryzifoliimicrobium ureilyticus]|uniref:hypothetical protein n=1 Tax=Oryzifoliimicrobium ureilyticus TaxID=3113724 RepID=UPI0030764FFC
MQDDSNGEIAYQTFFYEGMIVGIFEDVAPTAPGIYRYIPARSIGHYTMGLALKAGGRPICYYASHGKRISFTVVERMMHGLRLDMFEVTVAD